MIAAIETPTGLCVIRWTGRKGLSVKALVWCGSEVDAAKGVVQLPDSLLKGVAFPSLTTTVNGQPRTLKVCAGCEKVVHGG